MKIEQNLAVPNTLALASTARWGCEARSVEDARLAQAAAQRLGRDFVVLGAGSNIIPAAIVDRFVCLMRIRGVQVVDETADAISVRVAAGEPWHGFVMFALANGWFGIENLALIPGLVGAAPVQNIGAYGVEVCEVVRAVGVLDAEGKIARIDSADCEFAYRTSVFQRRPDLVITDVELRLSKVPNPRLEYPQLREYLAANRSSVGQSRPPTPVEIAAAVARIRSSKLPDPDKHPNAGSFFKNPIVPADQAEALSGQISGLVTFPAEKGVKLSAAQLIDQAGWKTRSSGKVICWPKQALVLVNEGGVSTAELLDFAEQIRRDIQARFGVQLELEPSLLS